MGVLCALCWRRGGDGKGEISHDVYRSINSIAWNAEDAEGYELWFQCDSQLLSLVSKWAFISHLMETVLTHVRHIVKEWSAGISRSSRRSRHIACIIYCWLSTDSNQLISRYVSCIAPCRNLLEMILVQKASEFLHLAVVNLKPRYIKCYFEILFTLYAYFIVYQLTFKPSRY